MKKEEKRIIQIHSIKSIDVWVVDDEGNECLEALTISSTDGGTFNATIDVQKPKIIPLSEKCNSNL